MMWVVGVYVAVVFLAMLVGCALIQVHGKPVATHGRCLRWLAARKVELWSALIALIALLWVTFFHMLKLWLHM